MGFFDSLLDTAIQIYEWWDTRRHGEGSHYHYGIERSLDTLQCRVPRYEERYQGVDTRFPFEYTTLRESVADAMRRGRTLPDTEHGIVDGMWDHPPTPPADLLFQLLSD